jgi:AraC-like DNA-binding protein
MQKIPRPVLVLHEDAPFREQLAVAARGDGYQLRSVADWPALAEEVRRAPASALLVVDPYTGTEGRDTPSPELADLLHRFPSLAVTAAYRPERVQETLRLSDWGVTQVIDLEEESSAPLIAHRLRAARGRPLRLLIEGALPVSAGGAARAILAAAATVVAEGGQGRDLAASLDITTRTLTRWCRRALLPPPKRLLAWMRMLLATELLDDSGRSISDVARSCGYASDSSLRHALGGLLGRTPSELREAGAFPIASRAFVKALAEARSAGARYRAKPPQEGAAGSGSAPSPPARR